VPLCAQVIDNRYGVVEYPTADDYNRFTEADQQAYVKMRTEIAQLKEKIDTYNDEHPPRNVTAFVSLERAVCFIVAMLCLFSRACSITCIHADAFFCDLFIHLLPSNCSHHNERFVFLPHCLQNNKIILVAGGNRAVRDAHSARRSGALL
jgi:hypothetical protein